MTNPDQILMNSILASFARGGGYPLEAYSVFKTEEAMKSFYSVPENKATMYAGMLRVVLDGKSASGESLGQQLWWCIENSNGELELQLVPTSGVSQQDLQVAITTCKKYTDDKVNETSTGALEERIQALEDKLKSYDELLARMTNVEEILTWE